MTRLRLRGYQEEAVAAIYSHFANNPVGDPLVVMPTASGKSLVVAEFIRRSIDAWPATRVLVLTHVMELVEQNESEFRRHWNDDDTYPGGIYSAGLKRRDVNSAVLLAGIQSIYKRAEELGHFDLVLIDEVHLLPKSGEGRYRTYLAALRKINPAVRLVGLTATPYRLQGGYLDRGDDALFSAIAYDVKLEPLIEQGFLAPLIAKRPKNVIDTSGLHTVGGDFKADEVEEAAIVDDLVEDSIAEVIELAEKEDRHHWLIFACGIKHAELVVEELEKHGVEALAIFGHTKKDQRAMIVDRFKCGKLKALVNVGVLCTGFNAPCCDLMVVFRPTKSTSLFVQIYGRGMRTHPGKENCLVLDFGTNVERHGPINNVRPRDAGEGPPPTKTCPECQSIILAGLGVCPDCGYIFEIAPRTIVHEVVSSELSPIDMELYKPKRMNVRTMCLRKHEKPGKPVSMRVDFMCGMRTFSEWVCFEHGGFARGKAVKWWQRHHGAPPIPMTVNEAIGRKTELWTPTAVMVRTDGKYDRIVSAVYEEPRGVAPTSRDDFMDIKF